MPPRHISSSAFLGRHSDRKRACWTCSVLYEEWMLLGKIVKLNRWGGTTLCRQHNTCCVLGLRNLKSLASEGKSKVVIKTKHLKPIFVCPLYPNLLIEATQRHLCDQCCTVKLVTAWHFPNFCNHVGLLSKENVNKAGSQESFAVHHCWWNFDATQPEMLTDNALIVLNFRSL